MDRRFLVYLGLLAMTYWGAQQGVKPHDALYIRTPFVVYFALYYVLFSLVAFLPSLWFAKRCQTEWGQWFILLIFHGLFLFLLYEYQEHLPPLWMKEWVWQWMET